MQAKKPKRTGSMVNVAFNENTLIVVKLKKENKYPKNLHVIVVV